MEQQGDQKDNGHEAQALNIEFEDVFVHHHLHQPRAHGTQWCQYNGHNGRGNQDTLVGFGLCHYPPQEVKIELRFGLRCSQSCIGLVNEISWAKISAHFYIAPKSKIKKGNSFFAIKGCLASEFCLFFTTFFKFMSKFQTQCAI